MSEQCTYASKAAGQCQNAGVGRDSPTARHWLCDEHLAEFQAAFESGDAKKIIGVTIRAGGGAEAMTERMQPSIDVAAKLLSALSKRETPPN